MSNQQAAELKAALKAARAESGWSQRTLAMRARIGDSTLIRIENEEGYDPRLSRVTAIAEALGLRLALVADDGDASHAGGPSLGRQNQRNAAPMQLAS